jgi:hypothetical protein
MKATTIMAIAAMVTVGATFPAAAKSPEKKHDDVVCQGIGCHHSKEHHDKAVHDKQKHRKAVHDKRP